MLLNVKYFGVCILVAVSSVVWVSSAIADTYSPRDFVKSAPANLFYTDDEMSSTDKDALVKGGFKRTSIFDCSAWGVSEEGADRLVMQYCSDSSVTVHVYRDTVDRDVVIVAVASVRASGKAGDLSLFRIVKSHGDFKPLSQQQLSDLGIVPLTENDFLKDSERFPVGQAQPVKLSLGDNGDLKGELFTWMDPRWETRTQRFDVYFAWEGKKFSKSKRDLNG